MGCVFVCVFCFALFPFGLFVCFRFVCSLFLCLLSFFKFFVFVSTLASWLFVSFATCLGFLASRSFYLVFFVLLEVVFAA